MTNRDDGEHIKDEIPLIYVDAGKYFAGTNPIIIDGNAVIQWLDRLAHADAAAFKILANRFGLQLAANGFLLSRILYYPASHELAPIFETEMKASGGVLTSDVVPYDALDAWHKTAAAQCPLLLSVQDARVFSFFLAPLKYGINVGLMSERTLLPNERLHCFIYLSVPHVCAAACLSEDISDAVAAFNLKASTEWVDHTQLTEADACVIALNARILQFLPDDFQFQNVVAYEDLYGAPFSTRAYEQIEKDLLPLIEEYEATEEKLQRRRKVDPKVAEARKNQKFMSSIHTYASSLQGATEFFRNIIVSTAADDKDQRSDRKKDRPVKEKESHHVKGGGKAAKPEKKSKAQLIKEENESRLKEQELAKYRTILATAIENCSAVRNVREKLKILDSLKIAQGSNIPEMNAAFVLAKMSVHVAAWKEDMLTKADLANSREDADFINAVAVIEKLFQIYDSYLTYLRVDQLLDSVIPALCIFGFTDAAEVFINDCAERKNKTGNPFSPAQLKQLLGSITTISHSVAKYRIKMDYTRFQMMFCGHLFLRSLDSHEDARVLFKPDKWQVDLLDAVDRNESALICAPTSSGKTFICYYAMEKILRANNEDVVIYVAPNKALMNQVAADIYARFNHKSYPANSNTHLFGMLSDRDVLHPFDCQILVTFPQVFEKYALSPLHADLWTRKVKYIILDEIHTIGEEGKGSVWEKIIQLAQCPILALSATVGNRQSFWQWMTKVQGVLGIPCRLIEQNERFSDLKRYIYSPKTDDAIDLEHFDSIKWSSAKRKELKESRVIQMHPLLSLSRQEIVEKDLPPDYQFLPGDVMRLVDGMCSLIDLPQLSLKANFGSTFRISKSQARAYENLVKETLRNCIKSGALSPSALDKLFHSLYGPAALSFDKTSQSLQIVGTKKYLSDHLLPLLVDLSNEDKLPVIIFHFDRQYCSELAAGLIEQLEKAENSKKLRRSKDEKGRISEIEKHQKQAKRLRDAEKKATKDSWIDESLEEEVLADLSAGLNRMDPELAFQDPRYKVRDSDLDELIEKYKLTRRMTTPLEKSLLTGLRRGIGVHHRGVPKKYLELVEHLFRLRHLQVVIATSTLALGINMPCKAVVFAGDDLALTPTEYRQMAGRAGRRGYDDLGHVIFWGLSKAKADRLITSALPSIQAEYPVSATYALQLSHLISAGTVKSAEMRTELNAVEVDALVKTVLERHLSFPLSSLNSSHTNLSFHFRLLLDYLVKFGLLSPYDGLPTIYARLPLMLSSQDSAPFLLLVLLTSGWIDKVTTSFYESPDKTLKALMLIFCSLFQPRFLPMENVQPSSVLEPLPLEIQAVLKSYNLDVLSFVSIFAEATCGSSTVISTVSDLKSIAMDAWFNEGALILDATHFHSVISTTKLLPNSLGFPFYTIPPRVSRNSYIYAYYSHVDAARIEVENKVSQRDLWQDLYEMGSVLMQTASFVDSLVPRVEIQESTVDAMKELAITFDRKFKRMWA